MSTEFGPHNLTGSITGGGFYTQDLFMVDASSEVNASWKAFKAFDSAAGNSQWIAANGTNQWLRIHVTTKTILNNYTINSSGTNAPKNWIMEGSNDGSTWTTLDTRTNVTSWPSAQNFTCSGNTTPYSWYRLSVSSDNGANLLVIVELSLFTDSPLADADFLPHDLTTNTSHSPVVVSTSPNHPSWDAFMALDGSQAGLNYCLIPAAAGTWSVDNGSGNYYETHAYRIGINNQSEPLRAPKDWMFEGSNDGSNWTALHTVSGETSFTNGEIRTYYPSILTGSYRRFRLNISANNGDGSWTQLAELWMVGIVGTPPASTFNPAWGSRSNQLIGGVN